MDPRGRRAARSFAGLVLLVVLGLVAAACGSATSTSTSGNLATTDIGAGLRGPAGLSATTVATGMANVAALTFDAGGRLWAATSSMSDDGTDAVYVVDAAGTATRVIADLHTPLGLLWIGDELFVAEGHEVDAYGAFDGSSFADRRVVVDLPAGAGELNQLARLADGRVALGISAPCNACVVTGAASASVVTFEPDGSDLEVLADGIRAPVGLLALPGSNALLVTMNQRDDLGEATVGDWLAVVTAGQSWGFPDCPGPGGEDCTGPAPVAELDVHAAVSGVALVTGELGATLGTAAVVAEWNTGKVLAVPLDLAEPQAPAQPEVLFTGMAHPMAVVTGPDGALYLGDWATGSVVRIAATAPG